MLNKSSVLVHKPEPVHKQAVLNKPGHKASGKVLGSSFVAAGMAAGVPLDEAVLSARDFVYEAIRTAPKLGKGNGPLNHGLVLKGDEPDETPNEAKTNPFASLKGMMKPKG